jgi:hypothetical protein
MTQFNNIKLGKDYMFNEVKIECAIGDYSDIENWNYGPFKYLVYNLDYRTGSPQGMFPHKFLFAQKDGVSLWARNKGGVAIEHKWIKKGEIGFALSASDGVYLK